MGGCIFGIGALVVEGIAAEEGRGGGALFDGEQRDQEEERLLGGMHLILCHEASGRIAYDSGYLYTL